MTTPVMAPRIGWGILALAGYQRCLRLMGTSWRPSIARGGGGPGGAPAAGRRAADRGAWRTWPHGFSWAGEPGVACRWLGRCAVFGGGRDGARRAGSGGRPRRALRRGSGHGGLVDLADLRGASANMQGAKGGVSRNMCQKQNPDRYPETEGEEPGPEDGKEREERNRRKRGPREETREERRGEREKPGRPFVVYAVPFVCVVGAVS